MVELTQRDANLSIGRLFRYCFGLVGGQWPSLALIGLLYAALPQAIFGVLRVTGMVQPPGDDLVANFRGAPGENLALGIASIFLMGAVAHLAVTHWSGGRTNLAQSMAIGARAFGRGLGIRILYYLAVFLGTLAFIVPGLLALIAWCVALPAAVLEEKGVMESFERSAQLTRHNRWAILGAGLLFTLIVVLALLVVGVLMYLPSFFVEEGVWTYIDELIVTPITTAVTTLMVAIFGSAIYYDLRTSREGEGDQRLAEVFA